MKELPPELVEDAEAKDKQPVKEDAARKMFDAMRLSVTAD